MTSENTINELLSTDDQPRLDVEDDCKRPSFCIVLFLMMQRSKNDTSHAYNIRIEWKEEWGERRVLPKSKTEKEKMRSTLILIESWQRNNVNNCQKLNLLVTHLWALTGFQTHNINSDGTMFSISIDFLCVVLHCGRFSSAIRRWFRINRQLLNFTYRQQWKWNFVQILKLFVINATDQPDVVCLQWWIHLHRWLISHVFSIHFRRNFLIVQVYIIFD